MRTFECTVDLEDLMECRGIDGFNDLVESALEQTGQIAETDVLEDIGYDVIGADGRRGVRLRITADVVDISQVWN